MNTFLQLLFLMAVPLAVCWLIYLAWLTRHDA